MRTLSGTLIDYELIDILDTKPIPDHGTLIRSKLVTIDLIIINRFNHACRARYCFTITVGPSVRHTDVLYQNLPTFPTI